MKTRFALCGAVTVILAMFSVGCTTPGSQSAKPLQVTVEPGADLTRYQTATVTPFTAMGSNRAAVALATNLPAQILDRLNYDFGDLFKEVRNGPPLGTDDELVVTGIVTNCAPGSKTARSILIGLASASLDGEMVVKEGKTQKLLLRAPFAKLWAWGGTLGASKGIEDLIAETSAAAAVTIAHARGSKPPPK